MQKNFDIICIGAGPTSLNCAYKLIKENPNLSIAIFDKGRRLLDRKASSIEGIGGAGAYSDFKFTITNDFGGNLWEKIGKKKSIDLQKDVDEINKTLFMRVTNKDYPKLHTSNNSTYKKICTQHNLHLLDADIRHLGTDFGQMIYEELYKELIKNNVKFYIETEVKDISFDEISKKYIINTFDIANKITNSFEATYIVLAGGRSGSKWVKNICESLNIQTISNKVDLGIRFECPDEIWDHITKDLYECKVVYKTKTYEDNVRTFCMNPSGLVALEKTKNGITVNGHAYEDPAKKTKNTNFALLVNKTLTEPFNNSSDYGEAIVKLSNMVGGGVIVQRYGDLIRGKRSTKDRLKNNTVIPTLDAEPGDLSLVLPKRILDDIIEMIQALDHLVPGMINDDNLLYGIEVKYYNNIVNVDADLQAKENLFVGGDTSGWTHSLSQASASGLYIAEKILEKFN